MALPVKEVHIHEDSVVLVVPAESGRRGRYHALRILLRTGETKRIGYELPLSIVRKVAERCSAQDGRALPKG